MVGRQPIKNLKILLLRVGADEGTAPRVRREANEPRTLATCGCRPSEFLLPR